MKLLLLQCYSIIKAYNINCSFKILIHLKYILDCIILVFQTTNQKLFSMKIYVSVDLNFQRNKKKTNKIHKIPSI